MRVNRSGREDDRSPHLVRSYEWMEPYLRSTQMPSWRAQEQLYMSVILSHIFPWLEEVWCNWVPLIHSWTKQNYRWLLVMLTFLVIRLCLQGSKSSFQLTRSSNFMPSLACTHSMYGLVLVCVVVSSTLMLSLMHFSPHPSNLVWVYLSFRRLKIITAEAFTVYDWGLVIACYWSCHCLSSSVPSSSYHFSSILASLSHFGSILRHCDPAGHMFTWFGLFERSVTDCTFERASSSVLNVQWYIIFLDVAVSRPNTVY